jgi:hypothetical protein
MEQHHLAVTSALADHHRLCSSVLLVCWCRVRENRPLTSLGRPLADSAVRACRRPGAHAEILHQQTSHDTRTQQYSFRKCFPPSPRRVMSDSRAVGGRRCVQHNTGDIHHNGCGSPPRVSARPPPPQDITSLLRRHAESPKSDCVDIQASKIRSQRRLPFLCKPPALRRLCGAVLLTARAHDSS